VTISLNSLYERTGSGVCDSVGALLMPSSAFDMVVTGEILDQNSIEKFVDLSLFTGDGAGITLVGVAQRPTSYGEESPAHSVRQFSGSDRSEFL
jgi:hypothetical protein